VRSQTEEYRKVAVNFEGTKWDPILKSVRKKLPLVPSKKIRKALNSVRVEQAAKEGLKYYNIPDDYRKLDYVRYADDLLFGFSGPKKDAVKLLSQIVAIIESQTNLSINIEKSKVIHHKKGIQYLGYLLLSNKCAAKWSNKRGPRSGGTRLNFRVPLEQLFKTYSDKGFLKIAKKGAKRHVGRRQDKWLFLESD
jgi:hypothetical protein